jgi:hypothetical protein
LSCCPWLARRSSDCNKCPATVVTETGACDQKARPPRSGKRPKALYSKATSTTRALSACRKPKADAWLSSSVPATVSVAALASAARVWLALRTPLSLM